MTIITLLRGKNEILRKWIGIDFDLVPENQMDNLGQYKQVELVNNNKNPALSCPYCMAVDIMGCGYCPMFKAGNANNIPVHTDKSSPAYEPMIELIEQYNRELGIVNEKSI